MCVFVCTRACVRACARACVWVYVVFLYDVDMLTKRQFNSIQFNKNLSRSWPLPDIGMSTGANVFVSSAAYV